MSVEFKFNSWLDFVDQATNGHTDMTDQERASRRTEDRSWTHTKNFDEAAKLAREGWVEGANKLSASFKTLDIHSKEVVRELKMSMVGPGTLDMNRYLMGHPESWVTWPEVEIESDRGVVTILYNGTASAGVSAETMFRKGAIVCALIDLLEQAGRRVELILTLCTERLLFRSAKTGNPYINTEILVKAAQDPLDMDRVAFAVAHPSCLRRLGFSLWEQVDRELRQRIGISDMGGYGRCKDINKEGAINVPSSDLLERGEDYRGWLKKSLADYGIEWSGE